MSEGEGVEGVAMAKEKGEQEGEEFRHIVRILDTDLDGKMRVPYSLCGIKAVSYTHLTLPTNREV